MDAAQTDMPDLASIREARARIAPYVAKSSLVRSEALSAATGCDVLLKLETQQPSGSFKLRGATNAVMRLHERGVARGVTTASTGNHARAVATAAQHVGLPVRAFVAGSVAASRIRALQHLGVEIDRSADNQTAAIVAAEAYADKHGFGFVPPFDDADVISGQGTIGLELVEQADNLDIVAVPVSGGGLISGIGLAIKALRPEVRVVGVCAELAPAMLRSFEAGHPVTVPEVPTVAVSLMGDLGPNNQLTFRIARRVVDILVAVSEADISDAVNALRDDDGMEVEGAAAAAAAWVRTAGLEAGARVAVLVTGRADEPDPSPINGEGWSHG